MATKEYGLPDKPNIIFGETSNGQYSSLNLNSNHKSLPADIVFSKSIANDSKKGENYEISN